MTRKLLLWHSSILGITSLHPVMLCVKILFSQNPMQAKGTPFCLQHFITGSSSGFKEAKSIRFIFWISIFQSKPLFLTNFFLFWLNVVILHTTQNRCFCKNNSKYDNETTFETSVIISHRIERKPTNKNLIQNFY